MNMTPQIQEKLLDKMSREHSAFYDKLLTLEPKQIIERAYEKVTKDEIMGCLDTLELTYSQSLALLRSTAPLEECYQRWLKSDSSCFSDLHDCVEELAIRLETERKSKAVEGR